MSKEIIVKGNYDVTAPAQAAGLKKGDDIVNINGKPVESWDQMAGIIADSKGAQLEVTILREGTSRIAQITPVLKTTKNIFGEDIPRYVIGITAAGESYTKKLNPLAAITESVVQTYNIVELTVVSVAKILQGTVSTKTIGGPIMIAELAGQQAKLGAMNLLFFIALISVNLAILNILPIPVLDGGHLLFFAIELIIGRPVSIRIREVSQQAGMFVLILLMIFVFYNDIARIFSGQ